MSEWLSLSKAESRFQTLTLGFVLAWRDDLCPLVLILTHTPLTFNPLLSYVCAAMELLVSEVSILLKMLDQETLSSSVKEKKTSVWNLLQQIQPSGGNDRQKVFKNMLKSCKKKIDFRIGNHFHKGLMNGSTKVTEFF